MVVDKAIPLETNMDELYAISGTKGCYLSQELTLSHETCDGNVFVNNEVMGSFKSSAEFRLGFSKGRKCRNS